MTNLPAYLQNSRRGSASLDSLTKMATGSQPYISIAGNRFRAIDAVGDEQMVGNVDMKSGIAYFECVIIDTNDNVSKVYYDKPYDPSASDFVPPTCWSDNGLAPSSQVQSPQCRSCAECPKAIWGSAMSKLTGKQTKACNDVKKVAVYVPGFAGAFLLRVPPASLKELADYARRVIGNGASVAHVLTRISFEANGVGMLTFTPVGWIDEKTMIAIDELDGAKLDLLVGRNDKPRTGELPAPEQRQAIAHNPQQGNGTPPPSNEGMFANGRAEYGQQSAVDQTVAAAQAARAETSHVGKTPEQIAQEAVAAYIAQQAGQAKDEPAKRTRRTKAEMEAAKAQEQQGTAQANESDMFTPAKPASDTQMEVPAFLNGGKAGATAPVGPSGGTAAARMQTPAAPPADLAAALDAAFKL